MSTLRQREANRRNGLLNKGARSPDAASAANGRTHGLCASKWLRDDERERLAERTAELEDELMPDNAAQRAVVAEIAAAVVRIESCDMDEENWRFHRSQRAEYYWDEDRQAEAEALMEKLDRNPSLYVRKLRQTLQGARRLRRAFAALAALVSRGAAGEGEPGRPLDAVSRERAFDLLGLEPEERQGVTPLDLPGGRSGDDAALAAHQAALFAEQLADLDRLTSERYVELDQKLRLEAMLGNFPGIDDQTRLIRRYRAEAQRRRDLGLKELRRLQDENDEFDDDVSDEEFYRRTGSLWRRSSPTSSFATGPAASAEARPMSQPGPEAAQPPAPAADAAAGSASAAPRVETPANPHAGESSPRLGQPDESGHLTIGPRRQPPPAESYVQKAAHRTLQ
jgi:hypothetical protein